MFVSSSDYKQHLKTLVDNEEGELRVAVAFWGKGAVEHIHPNDKRPIRMICNLLSGGTNPKVIEDLWERAKADPYTVKIGQCDRLHAKVILGSHQALIGSANLSSNGLSMEDDEVANWIEAGIMTTDIEELTGLGDWFEKLWSSDNVRPISAQDLSDAREAWKRRRGVRTNPNVDASKSFSLEQWSASQLRDRPVYMMIYRTELSPAGSDALKSEQEKLNASKPSSSQSDDLNAFERWNHFPKDHPGQTTELVFVYWEQGSKPVCEGVGRSLNLRRDFRHANGQPSWIDLSVSSSTLLQQSFSEKEQRALTRCIAGSIEKIWKAAEVKDRYGRVVPLFEVAHIVNNASRQGN
jgi:hypothetical protein